MFNFWKLAYKSVKEQRDQHKVERDTLIDDLSWYRAKVSRLEDEIECREKSHIELYCDKKSLHDENKKLERENKKLERENEEFKESHIKHIANMENYYKDRVQKFKEENKALRLQSDTYFEQWQNEKLKGED